MMNYKIKDSHEKIILETIEQFKESFRLGPRAYKQTIYNVDVNGTEIQIVMRDGHYHLPIHMQKIRHWMDNNGYSKNELITSEIIDEAITKTKGLAIDGSRHELVLQHGASDLARRLFKLAKQAMEDTIIPVRFVKNLDKKRDSKIKEYEYALLYAYASRSVRYISNEYEDDHIEDKAKRFIAQILMDAYDSIENDKINLNNADNVVEYMKDFEWRFGYPMHSETLELSIKAHKIYESLSKEEIIEYIKVINDEDREHVDFDLIKSEE